MTTPQPNAGADRVSSVRQLRTLYAEPNAMVLGVRKAVLDEHHQAFIANSPFIVLATADANGQPAVSPKGGDPGFVEVLDGSTLLIADRPGNNNIRGLCNLIENPRVALAFFVPGVNEVLRIEGTAHVVSDDSILSALEAYGKRPKTATVIHVELVYIHCGKALIRSKAWDPSRHVQPGKVPTLGRILVDELHLTASAEQLDASMPRTYEEAL